MINPKMLFVTMKEVLRAHSEPGAIDAASKVNFQRGRSTNGHQWLNWACDASGYLDCLAEPQQMAMDRVYWDTEPIPEKARQLILIADEALEKWYNAVPVEVKKEGEKIARRM